MRQTAYSRLKRDWKVAFSHLCSVTLIENMHRNLMRKAIPALIFSLGLLTITSVFIFLPPIDKVTTDSFSGAHFSVQTTPSAIPTSLFTTEPAGTPVRSNPPLSLTLILLGLCCFFLLLIGMFILGFILRNQNIKEWKKDQQSESH